MSKPTSKEDDVAIDDAHDAWFRKGVEQALASKDAPISNDEVRDLFAKKRATWKAGIAAE
jgi:hypothetical protein